MNVMVPSIPEVIQIKPESPRKTNWLIYFGDTYHIPLMILRKQYPQNEVTKTDTNPVINVNIKFISMRFLLPL